jgi:hypothetical protein
VTLALKNIAMSYPAADYYGHPRATERHRHRFFDDMHSFIAAMARHFPIQLAITVGHPAMVAIFGRLARKPDPWRNMGRRARSLSAARERLERLLDPSGR